MEGPRVLMIHGNPGSPADFAELLPRLHVASEVHALALPGFGARSEVSVAAQPSSLLELARDAFAVVDGLGWQRFDVIGHSHGAGIAQAMAWLHGERVERLLLVGSLGLAPHAAYRQLAIPGVKWLMLALARALRLPGGRLWLRALQRGVLRDAFHPQPVPAGRLEREVERVLNEPRILVRMAELARARPCADLALHARDSATATHFVHGASDRLVPERYPRAVHEARLASGRASTFERLEGAGHMLPLTHAAEIAARYNALVRGPTA